MPFKDPEVKKAYLRTYQATVWRPKYPNHRLEWGQMNPQRLYVNNRKSMLKNKYGLTEEQYDHMLELQGGVCAICGHPPKTRRLAVDHDHKTGRVRCLACYVCNRNRIGVNTPATALKVAEICNSDFDGRLLSRSSLQEAPETA